MTASVLDGKRIGEEIRAEVQRGVRDLRSRGLRPPGLAAVLVGEDPASRVYVASKVKACGEAGVFSQRIELPASASTAEVLATVQELNGRPEIDGILVQLPLPRQVEEEAVLRAISPEKDVDGFHPVNFGLMTLDRPLFEPCTPAGILELLKRYQIPLEGRRAVVVGRSHIVGKPMAILLLRANATVTVCHSRTRNLAEVCREADILVAAIGRKGTITAEHIREGAVVVDVGMNRVTDPEEARVLFGGDEKRIGTVREKGATLVGDVVPVAMWEKASWYTPVPGGVGPLTIAMLLSNTLKSARRRLGVA
ncbi:MAG: bifunctional methylenetetrahydrofolate dehydrogenase/methenyltetrahydrofolate cyclohydrolase FolD [Acidobacteriota bacterium]